MSKSHHADAGEVGETGEHGDLGSNAANAPRAAAGEANSREGKVAAAMKALMRQGYGKAKAKKMAEAMVAEEAD